MALFASLLVFSIASDLTAAATASAAKISGSFLSLVLAMVFLGGTPACLIGVATIVVGWLRWRDSWSGLLNNLVAYAWFPLLGGIVFTEVSDRANLTESDGFFYLLTFVVFVLALAVNFLIIAVNIRHGRARASASWSASWSSRCCSSEVFAALLAVGVAYLYIHVGLAAIALVGIVLFTFQRLLGQLLLSEQRAEELEQRGTS